MKSGKSTSAKARFRDLGELARQSNHLVAAAVLVFMASILLQFLLARPMMQAAGWIHGNWGKAGAAILGPLLTDGCTTLVLLAVAFPFGRVTAARPWPAGVALVLLVHGFWFCFHFVVGEHTLLWGNLMPALGRSLLIVLTLLGVVALLRWGREVALVADGIGKPKDKAGKDPSGEARQAHWEGDPEPPSAAPEDTRAPEPKEAAPKAPDSGSEGGIEKVEPTETSSDLEQKAIPPCKDPTPGDVSRGER